MIALDRSHEHAAIPHYTRIVFVPHADEAEKTLMVEVLRKVADDLTVEPPKSS